MPLKTTKFDAEQYFKTATAQRELLQDAFSTGDAGYIADALGIVARVRGVTQVAESAGVTRMALYKGLTKSGDPKLSTVLGVLRAAGFDLAVKKSA